MNNARHTGQGDAGLHLPEQRFALPAGVTAGFICLNNARHTGAGRYPVNSSTWRSHVTTASGIRYLQ
ncbi:MAG: hypothetical protein PF630_07010 [Gammaproteobacteria bacterium]|jgi:hypothetical protein|nr:hypothetical protein [Gammaproteobacteria bacterium]